MADIDVTVETGNGFYDGFQSSLKYSTMVRIISAIVPVVSLIMYGLLEGSMRAAKRGDILHGRDIAYSGGPDELPAEMWILIKAKKWSKVKRGLWHAFVLVWIVLLPVLLLQFGSWKRGVCSADVLIIETDGKNSNDWFNTAEFNTEQTARVALTFRHNLGIGMSTNATVTRGMTSVGRPGALSAPELYTFRQCLYWTGEVYDGCESSQEIKETFASRIRVTPLTWNITDGRDRSLSRTDMPYTQEIEFFEQEAVWAESPVRCLTTFETRTWVCTFKFENSWHVADITAILPSEGGQLKNVPLLKLEGANMEDGEWVWYATTVAAEINAGGFILTNVNDARQMAMLFAKFDYLLHAGKQTCKVIEKESFVASYIWLAILTITAVLCLIMVWLMFTHNNSVRTPVKGPEWHLYGARIHCSKEGKEDWAEGEENGGGMHQKNQNICLSDKNIRLLKGKGTMHYLPWSDNVQKSKEEKTVEVVSVATPQNEVVSFSDHNDMDVELNGFVGTGMTRAQSNKN